MRRTRRTGPTLNCGPTLVAFCGFFLACRFPSLKVAYLDNAVELQHGPTQYSVLIRNRRAADPVVDPTKPFNKIVEAYRIRMPHNK